MSGRADQTGDGGRRGYTLVELVVVVGIIIVMTIAALPFFTAMMRNSQLDAAARQLAGNVREARGLAIQTGWQYRIVGFNAGGGQPKKNQYHVLGKSSPGGAWPADAAEPFQSATQMAGAWVNFAQLYPTVSLNPAVGTPSFYVSFNAQGVAFEWNPTAGTWMTITQASGSSTTRQVTITAAGGVKIQ
jgi:Tfp pilus assembly protein FimT